MSEPPRRPKDEALDDTVVFGMCTRNEADTIRETMQSIRDQTTPPDVVVVCDDSDDGTTAIVESVFTDSTVPVDVFQQEHYEGHGGARQELFERAATYEPDLLCLLDAEHAIGPDWFAEVLAFRAANPEYDLLTGPGCPREVHRPCESPHDPLYYRHATMAVEFATLERVGGWDPDFGRGEDWDLALRLYRADVRAFTSTRWCSRFIGSVDFTTRRARIAGNPTSVPYLAKYGPWYARFHPAQVLKDAASVLFYFLLVVAVFSLPLGPLAPSVPLFAAGFVAVGYALAYNVYHSGGSQPVGGSVEQPLFYLLYTAPAVVRSFRQVAAGRYGRESGTN